MTDCTGDCAPVPKLCQPAGTRKPVPVDYTRKLENLWTKGEVRQLGEAFRPTRPTGVEYSVTNASGQSGAREPVWRNPEIIGGTYTDGSLQLVAQAISNASLSNTIQSSTWSGPAELTIDGEGVQTTGGEQKAFCFVSGNTPGVYRITNSIVYALNGETDKVQVDIEIQ